MYKDVSNERDCLKAKNTAYTASMSRVINDYRQKVNVEESRKEHAAAKAIYLPQIEVLEKNLNSLHSSVNGDLSKAKEDLALATQQIENLSKENDKLQKENRVLKSDRVKREKDDRAVKEDLEEHLKQMSDLTVERDGVIALNNKLLTEAEKWKSRAKMLEEKLEAPNETKDSPKPLSPPYSSTSSTDDDDTPAHKRRRPNRTSSIESTLASDSSLSPPTRGRSRRYPLPQTNVSPTAISRVARSPNKLIKLAYGSAILKHSVNGTLPVGATAKTVKTSVKLVPPPLVRSSTPESLLHKSTGDSCPPPLYSPSKLPVKNSDSLIKTNDDVISSRSVKSIQSENRKSLITVMPTDVVIKAEPIETDFSQSVMLQNQSIAANIDANLEYVLNLIGPEEDGKSNDRLLPLSNYFNSNCDCCKALARELKAQRKQVAIWKRRTAEKNTIIQYKDIEYNDNLEVREKTHKSEVKRVREKLSNEIGKLRDLKKPTTVVRKLGHSKEVSDPVLRILTKLHLRDFHHFEETNKHMEEAKRMSHLLEQAINVVQSGHNVLVLVDEPYFATALAEVVSSPDPRTAKVVSGGCVVSYSEHIKCENCLPGEYHRLKREDHLRIASIASDGEYKTFNEFTAYAYARRDMYDVIIADSSISEKEMWSKKAKIKFVTLEDKESDNE